jgi:hypothetical protein
MRTAYMAKSTNLETGAFEGLWIEMPDYPTMERLLNIFKGKGGLDELDKDGGVTVKPYGKCSVIQELLQGSDPLLNECMKHPWFLEALALDAYALITHLHSPTPTSIKALYLSGKYPDTMCEVSVESLMAVESVVPVVPTPDFGEPLGEGSGYYVKEVK